MSIHGLYIPIWRERLKNVYSKLVYKYADITVINKKSEIGEKFISTIS